MNQIFNFSSPVVRQRLLYLSLWLIIAVGFFLVRSVILPFILASLLAYVFHPLVSILGRINFKNKPMPRAISVIIIYLFFVGVIFLISAFFVPQLYVELVRLVKELSVFINSIDENAILQFGQKLENFFREYQLPVEIIAPTADNTNLPSVPHKSHWISIDILKITNTFIGDLVNYVKSEAGNIISSAQHIFTGLISSLFMLMLVFMITGFLLVDVKSIKRFLFSLVPSHDWNKFNDFLNRLDQRLSGVVRGQLIICVVNAILTLIGLLIFNVKFAVILATMAGIFSLVPVFGSIVSTIPIVLVALTISPFTALFSLLWIIGIHILEANFLNPKIMGNAAKIHPVLIILALLVGERFYGIIGALLAVPIMSVIVTIFLSILNRAQSMSEGVSKSETK